MNDQRRIKQTNLIKELLEFRPLIRGIIGIILIYSKSGSQIAKPALLAWYFISAVPFPPGNTITISIS
jgi:hypothetical protein